MNNYTIFIKDNETRVVLAEQVTRDLTRELKKNGFTQYPYTIEANSQKEAIQELNRQGGEHLEDLSQFVGNHCFACAIIVLSFVAAFLLSL
ncbi:hypothetical protein [Enterobacter sp. CC120223-11]|uniref:hypothetical protein n=1 Tax=Enterobacter sp. CC120223-11 TaxID=1378073 RepID=UPI000BD7DCC0|nr:hypothetical protein [Enterobacter sp. CC120223-11]SNY59134.1 hypothetical protein SAMN02744775_00165 [Enterobacter sp. CC120223-11]